MIFSSFFFVVVLSLCTGGMEGRRKKKEGCFEGEREFGVGETEFLLDSIRLRSVYVCVLTHILRNCIITASLLIKRV